VKEINKVHHQLLASATAIKDYHQLNLSGKIGITFNLAPCILFDPANLKDIAAVQIEDQLLNQIVLNPIFNGSYPSQALAMIQEYNPAFQPSVADLNLMLDNKPDFPGVNFYAPAQVKHDDKAAMGVSWLVRIIYTNY